jgi:hypothetical protein
MLARSGRLRVGDGWSQPARSTLLQVLDLHVELENVRGRPRPDCSGSSRPQSGHALTKAIFALKVHQTKDFYAIAWRRATG